MARGDTPHLGGEPDGGPAKQREVLAQFEAAIAGMHTREIQLRLRQLLAGPVPAPRTETGAQPDDSRAPAGSAARPFGKNGPGGGGGGAQAGGDEANGDGDPASCDLAGGAARDPGPLPPPVAELVRAVPTPSARRQMQRLVSDARLDRWTGIETGVAARMVHPYSWLLNRAGDDGIRLTEAGHLPPAQVNAALRDLNAAAPGPGRRENQVPPVQHLRESAQAMGLLRKQHGQLLLTARGAELRSRPAAL